MDKRIHFALVCGAKSCPPIRVYTPEELDEGLDAAAAAFCEGARNYLALVSLCEISFPAVRLMSFRLTPDSNAKRSWTRASTPPSPSARVRYYLFVMNREGVHACTFPESSRCCP